MIVRALMILVIIGSFPVLQLPPKTMAQMPPSEAAKVLVDDATQALKSNDTEKAQVHLNILNQQLPTFVNSSSIQSVKVLLDDVSSALKNKNVNSALVHLNLVKEQLTPNGGSIVTPSIPAKRTTLQSSNIQSNHSPKAYDENVILASSGILKKVELKGDDIDGDPITFSIKSNPLHGTIDVFNSTSGVLIFNPTTGFAGNDSFTYQVRDSRGATSNIAQVSIGVNDDNPGSRELSSSQLAALSPHPELSQPSTSSEDTITSPETNNENSPSTGTDYGSICAKLQPVLTPSCSTLVNSDGSLTSEGTHALNCIKNGILLGGGAALVGVPLSIILKGLSMLAAPTGCSDVVNMNGFSQLGNIGSLSSLTSLLP